MRKANWLRLLAIKFFLVTTLFFACRKTDLTVKPAQEAGLTVEENFFKGTINPEPEVQAVIHFLERRNNLRSFVSTTVGRIGYPRWDKIFKTISKANSVNLRSTNSVGLTDADDKTTIYYLPFVRDSDNHVNAVMKIKISGSDTSFGYMCDWQYKNLENNPSNLESNAEKFAVFFIMCDSRVFGHTRFKIKDKRLFKNNGTETEIVELKTSESANISSNVYRMIEICVTVTSISHTCPFLSRGFACLGSFTNCDNCPQYCTQTRDQNYCYSGWENDGMSWDSYFGPISGGGGGDSGGWGDDGTPPPCGGQASTAIANPSLKMKEGQNVSTNMLPGGCLPGWEPDEINIEDYVLTPADEGILQGLQNEKNEAQAFIDNQLPCKGTKRLPGGIVVQPQATVAHLLIQEAYIATNVYGVAEYQIPGSRTGGRKGWADLANLLTGEIFEIKPTSLVGQGEEEAIGYVSAANTNCPPTGGTFPEWRLGTDFIEINLPYPLDPRYVLHAKRVTPGVITYEIVPKETYHLPEVPATIKDVVNELMKRRRLYPNKSFPELAIAYLRKLSETPQGRALVIDFKRQIVTTASAMLIAYVATAIYTEGVGLFLEAELLVAAKDLIYVAAIL
jgi:hypothetical protein